MKPPTLPAATVEAAVEAHGSIRAAARALGRPESTLRGILKRAAAEEAEPVRDEADVPIVQRRPNRAERRHYVRQSKGYRQARRATRQLRRLSGGWAGAFRPHHPSVVK